MRDYVIRRLLISIPQLLGICFITMLALELAPGDHRVDGVFRWDGRPELLQIPPETALVGLVLVDGEGRRRSVDFPRSTLFPLCGLYHDSDIDPDGTCHGLFSRNGHRYHRGDESLAGRHS